MADIQLQRPEAGLTTSITPNAEDRLVFTFESAEPVLTRDGDNLVMTFDDGAILTLTDFYIAYTSENMPEFVIGEEIVPGEQFFAAFENLMPAAGPAAGPQGSGNSVDTIAGELYAGLGDALGGLSQSFPDTFVPSTATVNNEVNLPPVLNGIVFDGLAIESGVGFDSSRPNAEYAGQSVLTGSVLATDPNGLELTFTLVSSPNGLTGRLEFNADGTFTFFLDNADSDTEALALGEVHTEFFGIQVSDGANTIGATIAINVYGSNDQPELFVMTDNQLEAYQQFLADYEANPEKYPDFTPEQALQEYAFPAQSDVKEDADGTSQSGSEASLSNSIGGQVNGSDVDSDPELTYYASLKDTFDYFDNGAGANNDLALDIAPVADADSVGSTVFGTYGKLEMDVDSGRYTYTLYQEGEEGYDNVQALFDGQSESDVFVLYVKDEHGSWAAQEVTMNVIGSNDTPTITISETEGNLKEAGVGSETTLNFGFLGKPTVDMPNAENPDADATASGKIAFADVDRSDMLTLTIGGQVISQEQDGADIFNAGPFYVDKDGNLSETAPDDYVGTIIFTGDANHEVSYEFTLNDESGFIQGLDDKEKFELKLPVKVSDDSTITQESNGSELNTLETNLTLTIEGTNDRPEVEAENLTLTEDTASETGTAVATDKDLDDVGNLEFFVGAGNAANIIGAVDKLVPDFITKESLENFDLLTGGDLLDSLGQFDLTNGTTAVGKYGYLSIDSDGEYTYKLYDTDAMQFMAHGEDRHETFTIYAKDAQGAWDYKAITVTVAGTNDKPTIDITETDSVLKEAGVGDETQLNLGFFRPTVDMPNAENPDADATASGKIAFADVDRSDMLTLTIGGQVISQEQDGADIFNAGPFYVDTDGNLSETAPADYVGTIIFTGGANREVNYEFTLNDESDFIQGLDDKEKFELKLSVKVNDDSGITEEIDGDELSTADTNLTFTIEGTNDRPEVEAKDLTLTEDTASETGTALATDKDSDDVGNLEFFVGAGSAANIIGAVDKLVPNEITKESLENFDLLTGGDLLDSLGQFDLTNGTTAVGKYGYLSIDSDGEYTYKLYDTDAMQHMDDNDQYDETFTIYVKDAQGAWNYETITVSIDGKNDAPVIHTYTKDLDVTEAGHGHGNLESLPDAGKAFAVGQMIATDIDVEKLTFGIEGGIKDSSMLELEDFVGDHKLLSELLGDVANTDVFPYDVSSKNDYGTLYMNSTTGTYVFVLDNDADATQALNDGEPAAPKFTITVSDGTETVEREITVNIEGTNDKPTLNLNATGDDLDADGRLTITENTGEVANSVSGSFTAYDVDKGETETLEFAVNVTRPELGNETLEALANAFLDAKGVSKDSPLYDIVNSDVFAKIYNVLGDSTDTPILDKISNLDGIKYGETGVIELGTNPVVQNMVVYGLYGKMVLPLDANGTPTGEYTYSLYTWDEAKDNVDTMLAYVALQRRDDDDALPTENFTISVKDENGAWDYQNITVEVQGYNDAPTISVPEIVVTEAGVGTTAGEALAVEAVDAIFGQLGDTLTGFDFVEDIKESLTTWLAQTMNSDYYLPNKANEGGSATGKISVKDDDAEGFLRFGLSHDGTNAKLGFDMPSLEEVLTSGVFSFSLEDLALITELTTSLSALGKLPEMISGGFQLEDLQELIADLPDADAILGLFDDGASLDALLGLLQSSITLTVQGEYGTFVLGQDGSYTYTLGDPELTNHLALGEKEYDTFTVKSYDIYGNVREEEVSVTIEGANDAPVINHVGNIILSEDDTASLTQQVKADDVDNRYKLTYTVGPDSTTILESLQDSLGDELLGQTVDQLILLLQEMNIPFFSFTIEPILEGLKESVSLEEAFAAIVENISASGQLPFDSETLTDLDPDDNFGTESVGTYGTLSINPETGEYFYTPNQDPESDAYKEIQALNDGETLPDTFTIYVQDEHGAWTSKDITVTINGVNEPVEITGLDSVTLTTYDAMAAGLDKNENTNASGQELKDGNGQPITPVAAASGEFTFNTNMTTAFGTGLSALTLVVMLGGVEMSYAISLDENNNTVIKDANGKSVSSIESDHGYLSITAVNMGTANTDGVYENGKIEYTYTQTKPYDHDGDVAMDSFKLLITDDKGRSDEAIIKIDMVDDAISLGMSSTELGSYDEASNSYIVSEDASGAQPDKAEGYLEWNGADTATAADVSVSLVSINGVAIDAETLSIQLGGIDFTLRYDTDGTLIASKGDKDYFSITLDGASEGAQNHNHWNVEQFERLEFDIELGFTAEDSDGSVDTYTVKVDTLGSENFEIEGVTTVSRDISHETNVVGAYDLAEAMNLSSGVSAQGITVNGVNVPFDGSEVEITGAHGKMMVAYTGGVLSYTYDQNAAVDHSKGAQSDSFEVRVERTDGNYSVGTVLVDIEDDHSTLNITPDATYGYTNTFTGSFEVVASADGAGNKYQINGVEVKVGNEETIANLGSILINSDGTYVLTVDKAENTKYTMEVKAYDADGSLSDVSATVEVNTGMKPVEVKHNDDYGMYTKVSTFDGNKTHEKNFTDKNDDIVIDSNKTGMYAENSNSIRTAKNILNSGSGNDKISIEGKESAMYADGEYKVWGSTLSATAQNTIDAGVGDDFVSLTGAYAMKADGALASNTVDLGAGDDFLHIDGKIEGTATILGVETNLNTLDGGDGRDTLKLENAVDNDTYVVSKSLLGNISIEGVDATIVDFEELAFGDADDVIIFNNFFGGPIDIDGGAGADLVRMDNLTGISIEDVLVEGGDDDDVDVLLAGLSDLEALKSGVENDTINNVEVLIASGKDVADGATAESVLKDLNAQDADGNWNVGQANSGWTEKTGTGSNVPVGYREFTNEDDNVTILVQSNLLTNQNT